MPETVICLHKEDIDSSHIGTCRICGQQRQYYPYEGHKSNIIKRGSIDGTMTDINPPSRDNSEHITEEQDVEGATENKEDKTPWPPPRRTYRTGVRGVYGF